jgi:uncharacterized membrane protein SpoIIM required for sporulation
MVLEILVNPKKAENKPWHIVFVSFVYSFIAIFFAHSMFPNESSILSIAFITIIFVPFFQRLFSIEEKKECMAARHMLKGNLLTRHKQIIYVFSAFFLGVVISMSFIFIFLPQFNDVFNVQAQTMKSLGYGETGTTAQLTDAEMGSFHRFFENNTKVMLLMFILSALFGAGAVFILTWNASIIAIYIGYFIQSLTNKGMATATAYLYGLPAGLASIALHGVPEIVAYFIAGLAGGILSVGIIREKIHGKSFHKILIDALVLLAIAELLIFIAAWIEALF